MDWKVEHTLLLRKLAKTETKIEACRRMGMSLVALEFRLKRHRIVWGPTRKSYKIGVQDAALHAKAKAFYRNRGHHLTKVIAALLEWNMARIEQCEGANRTLLPEFRAPVGLALPK